LALAVSLEDLGTNTGNKKATVLAKTLDLATGKLLDNRKSPSPKTGELDNRGSQFYLAMYWAQELAAQSEDQTLAAHFAPLAKTLADNEAKIISEFKAVQGQRVDIGGYYRVDPDKVKAVMRPSASLNAILAAAQAGLMPDLPTGYIPVGRSAQFRSLVDNRKGSHAVSHGFLRNSIFPKQRYGVDMSASLIKLPAHGQKIVPGQPVPDNPIIPFIEGDGIGVDITPVMKKVVDAAVAKAYGGKRKITWMEVYAGEKATRMYGPDVWLPAETRWLRCKEYVGVHQGPDDDPGRWWHPLTERRAAPGTRPLPVRAPGTLLQGRAQSPLKHPEDRHGDLSREHRGHLCRHRVGRPSPTIARKVIKFLQ
jgi:hypothetical protein